MDGSLSIVHRCRTPSYSILVIGASGVGKTSLIYKYLLREFVETQPTIEDTFTTKVNIGNQPVQFNFIDVAGSDDFAIMREQWLEDKDAYILVLSQDIPHSLEEAKHYFDRIKEINEESLVFIIENKTDLVEDILQEASSFAEEHDVEFHRVSAKMDESIDDLIWHILKEITKRAKKKAKKTDQCFIF